MSISLTEDVKTAKDLESNPRALLEQVRRTGRPVVIAAEAGKPAVVMVTAERYEWLIHLVNLSRLVNEAEESVRQGKARPAEPVFKELLGEKKRRAKKASR